MSGFPRVAVGGGGGASTRLEVGTKLVDGLADSLNTQVKQAAVRVWPQCREASWYVRARSRGAEESSEGSSGGVGVDTGSGCSPSEGGEVDHGATDASAARRAKTMVRRWCKANGIFRLVTLTVAGPPPTWAEVWERVPEFRRRLSVAFPGIKFVATVEPGGKTGRYHVQAGVDRYVSKDDLRALWPHGFTDIKSLSDKPGDPESVRKCAAYLAKYVGKSYEDGGRERGRHRYEVTQGCQPVSDVIDVNDLVEGRAVAIAYFDGEMPSFIWSSAEVAEFPGLPVRCGFW